MRFAIILAFLAGPAFAADADFDKHKTDALAHIEKQITALTEHKTCVGTATDKEAMKKCHEGMKDFREDMKTEHMDRKMKRMEERKAKMDAKAAPTDAK